MSIEDGRPVDLTEGSVLSKVFESEGSLVAQKRAKEVVRQASLNEAIRVIQSLEAEVQEIKMPQRFSREKKPSESVFKQGEALNPELKGLTEDEYKRRQLLINLKVIREKILDTIGKLETVVMDIEATKQE